MGKKPVRLLGPTEKIKILFTLHNLGPGGVERHLLNLLEKIDYSRFQPYVCCLEKYGDFIEPIEKMGVEVTDLSIEKLYSLHALLGIYRLTSYMRREKIDIVHNFLLKSIVIGTFAAKMARLPVVINSRRDMGWALNRKQLFMLNMTNRYTDKLVAVCETVKDITITREKIDRAKIEVIYNGIDLEEFSPERNGEGDAVRSEFGIAPGDIVVGSITHLTKVKGNEYLIRAAPAILSEFPKTRFLIVGDGPLRKDMEALCVKKGIRDRVVFAGQRNNIPEILSAMNIFVCPSISEGFSNSILEAMAMGKPVVATDVGGNKELIRNGENGILVNPGDDKGLSENILTIIRNRDMARQMGQIGRELVVQKYDLNLIVQQLMELYISVRKLKEGVLN